MQLVEADHLRRMAEGRAREAHQDKLDAEAAAAAAESKPTSLHVSPTRRAPSCAQRSSRSPKKTWNERPSERPPPRRTNADGAVARRA